MERLRDHIDLHHGILRLLMGSLIGITCFTSVTAKVCNQPLVHPGPVSNTSWSIFNASSAHSHQYSPPKAQLNTSSAWIPNSWQLRKPEYLQVDLGDRKLVTAVATKGLDSMDGFFVTNYKLSLSLDGAAFTFYKEGGVDLIFSGNTDKHGVKVNQLNCPVVSRFVRFHPTNISKGVALKVEVYGCNASTADQANSPFNMTDLRASNVTHSNIVISWSAVSDPNLLYFHLRYLSKQGDPHQVTFLPQKSSSHYVKELTKLTACTRYTITVLAFGRCTSALKTVTAQTTASIPAKPILTSAVSPSPMTIELKWKMPKSTVAHCPIEVTSYVISYRPVTGQLTYSIQVAPQTSTFKIKHLKSWTKYRIVLKAASRYGNGIPTTTEVEVDGKAPESPPTITHVNSMSAGSFTVKWKNPPQDTINGDLKGFYVNYREKGTNPWTEHFVDKSKTELTIDKLTEKTVYVLFIQLLNNKYRISTNVTEIYVKGQGPPVRLEVNATSTKPHRLLVFWKELVEPAAHVGSCCRKLLWRSTMPGQGWQEMNVTGMTNFTLKSLTAWTTYEVKVSLQVNGNTVSSNTKRTLVFGKTPGKGPTALTGKAISPNAIKMSWKDVPYDYVYEPVLDYVVFCFKVQPPYKSLTIETKAQNVTISRLEQNTEYAIEVAGRTISGVGIKSGPFQVTTKKKVPLPKAPNITKVDALSQNAINISWHSEDRDIKVFRIYITGSDGLNITEKHNARTSVSTQYTKIIKNLKAYTTYRIRIVAKKKKYGTEYIGPFSQEKNVTTQEGEPGVPINLKALVLKDGMLLQWQQPREINGVLRRYVIRAQDESSGTKGTPSVHSAPGTANNYMLKNLEPFSNYSAEVAAVTVAEGPSAKVHFTTAEGAPSEPLNVSVQVNGSRILLHWSKPQRPNGNVKRYKVLYVGFKEYFKAFSDRNEAFVPVNHDTQAVLDVYPGTNYTIKVSAETAGGFGRESKPLEILIPPQPLEPPPEPTVYVDSVTPSSVTLSFQKFEGRNAKVSAYQVIVERQYRRRRSTSTATGTKTLPDVIRNYNDAKARKERFYVTAKINPENLPMKFVVGDGKTYNGYYNAPLDPQTTYILHTRGLSNDPNGNIAYGLPSTVKLPITAARSVPSNPDSGWIVPLPIIVGVAGALLVLIILVVIIILYLRAGAGHRNRAKQNYGMNDVELSKLRTQVDPEQNRPMSLTGEPPINPEHPPLHVTSFNKHVTKLHKNDSQGFSTEYNQLEMGKEFSWDTAHLPENKPKNRYANIVAYDHSRVVLSKLDDQPGSDYINASYIDGYMKPNAYIATQGPLPGTFNDFWRMVWEVRTNIIIMLTNLQEKNKLKCHKYWPDDSVDYSDIKVSLHRREVYADYTIRTFYLQKTVDNTQESRQVKQFHFTVWPDHGVPDYATAILAFRRRVRAYSPTEAGPHIVHCSAGVGRTGTYIAIDSMVERLDKQGDVDVFNFIAAMRTRRIAMVQTEEQYVFVHDAILEYVTCGNTQITAQDLRIAIKKLEQVNQDSRMTGFEKEWKILNHASPILPKAEFQVALLAENVNKNRYSCVVPSDIGRVRLLPIDDDEATSYINAVYIDGYKQRNAFILTQCPLPNTVFDFWRMLSEHRSASVVMLCSLEEGDDYSKFWPESGNRDYEMITVECLNSKRGEGGVDDSLKVEFRRSENELIMRKFRVTDTRDPDSQTVVKLFQYIGWTETRAPMSCKGIISLVSLVEKWQQQSGNGPITILCSDGLGRAGTFAALIAVLERVKVEQVVDVFQAIKAMRIQRPHLVKYMDQYKFIHYAVQEYITAFDDYANFK